MDPTIRPAKSADILRTRTMQLRSLSLLGARHYTRAEIDSFLKHVGTLEEAVVGEGHCFIALDGEQQVIASGAWSRLGPCYARFSASGELIATRSSPVPGVATIRSLFVAPEHARSGLGRAMLQQVEADALASGIFLLRLTALLSAERFYRALGYCGEARGHMRLADGARLGCVRMERVIADPACSAA